MSGLGLDGGIGLLTGLRRRLTLLLAAELRAAEAQARGQKVVDLGPLEDGLRTAFRDVSRARAEIEPGIVRAPQPSEWRCPDCDAKLAGIAGATLSIVRPGAAVHVDVALGGAIEVVCPRCKNRHAYGPSERPNAG